MTMQHDNHAHKFHDTPWAEFGLVTALIIILLITASGYVW